jgi:hypothetical protein
VELLHLICIFRWLHWDENLWFSDVKFTHTSAQGAAVEPKNFSRTVFSAYFPLGPLKHPNNLVKLNRFQSFLAS